MTVRAPKSTLLRGINLSVSASELVAIVGPNGAGKSTLVNALAGDHPSVDGHVYLDGIDIRSLTVKQQAERRAAMNQASHIAFDFSAREVFAMGWVQDHRYDRSTKDRAFAEVADRCDINHLLQRSLQHAFWRRTAARAIRAGVATDLARAQT